MLRPEQFRILVADDEAGILNFISVILKTRGYPVHTVSNGLRALEYTCIHKPDLILLDIQMPDIDGYQALKEIRKFSTVPVIYLTAFGNSSRIVEGLNLGADDYLTKPFNVEELIARIEAVRKRILPQQKTKETKEYSHDNMTVNFRNYTLKIDDAEVRLTPIEWRLMEELVNSAGRFISYEMLLERVWGQEYRDEIKLLRTWISRLRMKLHPHGNSLIQTISGCGYYMKHL